MKLVTSNEEYKEKMSQLEKEMESKVENYELMLENRKTECDEVYLKEYMSAKENETLKTDLMEISTEIQSK